MVWTLVARRPLDRRLAVAFMIAVGIGFHNLGEGLAIGAAYNVGEVALGAKEIIALDPKLIEDRFQLNPGEGATMEMFGSVTLGMLGYVFLYTNKESYPF